MNIEIHPVKTRKDLKEFVRFPMKLYKNHPYWVPPLIQEEINTLSPDKNPAFESCEARYWLAYQNQNEGKEKKIVGRIAGILNKTYMNRWRKNYANFGWFDFIDDLDVSQKLIQTVENWVKEKNCAGLSGPFGFTNFDAQGMLIKGFHYLPTIASVYNHEYYPRHMETLGFKKDVDYLEFQAPVPQSIPDKAQRVAQFLLKKSNLKLIHPQSKKELLPYIKEVFQVINTSYRDLYSVVIFSQEQIEWYSKKYLSFIQPEYIKIIADLDNHVVGFCLALPSLSRAFQKCRGHLFPWGFLHILRALKKPEALDLYLVGILPQYQSKGLNAVFMTELNKVALKKGIKKFETNGELETNQKVISIWKHYQAKQHKRRRCYFKEIRPRME